MFSIFIIVVMKIWLKTRTKLTVGTSHHGFNNGFILGIVLNFGLWSLNNSSIDTSSFIFPFIYSSGELAHKLLAASTLGNDKVRGFVDNLKQEEKKRKLKLAMAQRQDILQKMGLKIKKRKRTASGNFEDNEEEAIENDSVVQIVSAIHSGGNDPNGEEDDEGERDEQKDGGEEISSSPTSSDSKRQKLLHKPESKSQTKQEGSEELSSQSSRDKEEEKFEEGKEAGAKGKNKSKGKGKGKKGGKKKKKNKSKAKVQPSWLMEMEALEEEKGVMCTVCQEGYTYKPNDLIGVYVNCSCTFLGENAIYIKADGSLNEVGL